MKFLNTLIDIVLTTVCVAFISMFAYTFYISNAAADLSNLLPYINTNSLSVFEIKGFTIAIVGIIIGSQLLKATFGHDNDHFAAA